MNNQLHSEHDIYLDFWKKYKYLTVTATGQLAACCCTRQSVHM